MTRELRQYCDLQVVSPLPLFPAIKVGSVFSKWNVYSKIAFQERFNEFEVYYPKYIHFPVLGDYFSFLSTYYSLKHTLKKRNILSGVDLINAHWAYPDGVAAVRLARKFGLPSIITIRGSDIHRDMKRPYFARLILRSLHTCNHIISVSQALKDVLVSKGIEAGKIDVVNNGVDFSKFTILEKQKCRMELGLEEKLRYILFVGRLEPVKGIDVLLKAFALGADYFQQTKIILLGTGSLEAQLKSLCVKYKIASSVLFVGNKNHNKINKWYGAADVFCLPSLNEGHPNVIMEAIASGRPVVASDVGEIHKFVTEKTGRLFLPGDHKGLFVALKEVLEADCDANLVRKSISNMTWKNSAHRYFNIYHMVINDHQKKKT